MLRPAQPRRHDAMTPNGAIVVRPHRHRRRRFAARDLAEPRGHSRARADLRARRAGAASCRALLWSAGIVLPLAAFMGLVWVGIVGRAPHEIAAGARRLARRGRRLCGGRVPAAVRHRVRRPGRCSCILPDGRRSASSRALTAPPRREEAAGAHALADRDDPARGRPRAHRADRGRHHHAAASRGATCATAGFWCRPCGSPW